MISLQDLKQELTDVVIDRFYDLMDKSLDKSHLVDFDLTVGEVIEVAAEEKVSDDLFENKEHLAVVISEQNPFFDRKDLRDDFIYALNHGLAVDMYYKADKADFEMLGIDKTTSVPYEDMSHDELGKVAALAVMTVGTRRSPIISAYSIEAVDTFLQDIRAKAEDQLIYDKQIYPDMTIDAFYEDKSLDDLISDVKIEDKEVKEKQEREIEER